MRIQELDPTKQYAVILQTEWASQEDIDGVSTRLKQSGINAVVLAGADVQESGDRYWGIYFAKDRYWLKRTDGSLYFYPSPAIAQAHLNELPASWQEHGAVVEFNAPDTHDVVFRSKAYEWPSLET
jgi:hypothetical protein